MINSMIESIAQTDLKNITQLRSQTLKGYPPPKSVYMKF